MPAISCQTIHASANQKVGLCLLRLTEKLKNVAPGDDAISVFPKFLRLHLKQAMNTQDFASGPAKALNFESDVYGAEAHPSVFSSVYRKSLAHRYNFLIPAEARVLEVGCGAGDLLHLIRAKVKIGIDLSPERIARAKASYPLLDVRLANVETGLLPEGPFDVIVISDTLNYTADVEVLLKAAPRVFACWHAANDQYL
jgi:2-polyprenyl-3-methyl-5-hydroxy-6-metoxy-1,4-benzoquinol methylase